jgi:hypothetical protein
MYIKGERVTLWRLQHSNLKGRFRARGGNKVVGARRVEMRQLPLNRAVEYCSWRYSETRISFCLPRLQPNFGVRARRTGMTAKRPWQQRIWARALFEGENFAGFRSSAISNLTWLREFHSGGTLGQGGLQCSYPNLSKAHHPMLPPVWVPTRLRHNYTEYISCHSNKVQTWLPPRLPSSPLFRVGHVPANSKYIKFTSRRFNEVKLISTSKMRTRRCCGYLPAALVVFCYLRDREHQESIALAIK